VTKSTPCLLKRPMLRIKPRWIIVCAQQGRHRL